jgi:hypothetical protein
MTVDDVLSHFRNSYQFSKQTGMSINNIRNWRLKGYIPISSQLKLQKISNGVLRTAFHGCEGND